MEQEDSTSPGGESEGVAFTDVGRDESVINQLTRVSDCAGNQKIRGGKIIRRQDHSQSVR